MSVFVSDAIKHTKKNIWFIDYKTRESLELPINQNSIYLGGLFSKNMKELEDIKIGVGDINVNPYSAFILEMNADIKESRLHYFDVNLNCWCDRQLFKQITKRVLDRLKLLIPIDKKSNALIFDVFKKNKNPEKVLFARKTLIKRVKVKGREAFFESGNFYPETYIVEHTYAPTPEKCPNIIYFAGPARSGTTAFGTLMSCVEGVDRSYFQPHKNIKRHGRQLIIYPGDKLIVMKETFGPLHDEELFDPISMLLSAGIPKQKLCIVLTLRNPLLNFASLTKLSERIDPSFYVKMQRHTINLYKKYKGLHLNVIPFSYDLFGLPIGELMVLRKLLQKTGFFDPKNLTLKYDNEQLYKNMILGEAEVPDFFARYVQSAIRKGRFKYTSNTINIPNHLKKLLNKECSGSYTRFTKLSRKFLEL
jgi:hypothetical protein